MESSISYWAVLVAAIASMVVGFVWYGLLFREKWMALMGYTPDSMRGMKMTANRAYAIQFVASIVMACVLARIVELKIIDALINSPTLSPVNIGISAGFWMWLGFVAPISLGSVLWEGRPWKLWFINASSWLVTLLIMGAILGFWR